MCFLSCKVCKNKTFTITQMDQEFPLLRCAACGQHIDKIGWLHDGETLEE